MRNYGSQSYCEHPDYYDNNDPISADEEALYYAGNPDLDPENRPWVSEGDMMSDGDRFAADLAVMRDVEDFISGLAS